MNKAEGEGDFDDLWRESAKKFGMFPRKQGSETWGVVEPDEELSGLLLFDRIWIPWWICPPPPIGAKGSFCDYETDNQVMMLQLSQRMGELHSIGLEKEDIDWETGDSQKKLDEICKSGLTRSIRYVAELYSKKNYNVIPVYGKSADFQAEFKPGLKIAYEASLRTISIASPKDLSIEQVFDFREDAEAVGTYRSLRLWLLAWFSRA